MKKILLELEKIGSDVSDGLKRFMNNEEMYLKYLCIFQEEGTLQLFVEAMENKDYKCAEMNMHTFKGITGNLSLTVLYELSKETMQFLKAEEYDKVEICTEELVAKYKEIVDVIRTYKEG